MALERGSLLLHPLLLHVYLELVTRILLALDLPDPAGQVVVVEVPKTASL